LTFSGNQESQTICQPTNENTLDRGTMEAAVQGAIPGSLPPVDGVLSWPYAGRPPLRSGRRRTCDPHDYGHRSLLAVSASPLERASHPSSRWSRRLVTAECGARSRRQHLPFHARRARLRDAGTFEEATAPSPTTPRCRRTRSRRNLGRTKRAGGGSRPRSRIGRAATAAARWSGRRSGCRGPNRNSKSRRPECRSGYRRSR